MQPFALFDLDNTLIDRQDALEGWTRDFRAAHSLSPDGVALVGATLRARAYPMDFLHLRESLGLADSVESLWGGYVRGMAARARCRPGVREALGQMRMSGWTLGLVTNGAADIQRAKMVHARLDTLFDGVCVSEEVGAKKPALAIFQAAAASCGTTLARGGWMVGDNPETDILGGHQAGLRTAWIAAGRPWPAGVRRPDLVAEDASEVISALAQREQLGRTGVNPTLGPIRPPALRAHRPTPRR